MNTFLFRRAGWLLCALCAPWGVLALMPVTAHAEQADRSKPLVYSADHLSYDDLNQTTILTGHVELTKGTIIVRGDRAEIHQDPEGYSYANATVDKGLAYIREKRDGVNEYFEGYGKRIDYDGKNDVSTLTGQAVARRLQGLTTPIDEVHGSVIRYDGQTGFYTATSNGSQPGSSGRVRGMIAPTTTAPAGPASAGSAGAVSSAASAPTAASGARGNRSSRTGTPVSGTLGDSATDTAPPATARPSPTDANETGGASSADKDGGGGNTDSANAAGGMALAPATTLRNSP